ncbi:MAG: 3-dehydroquinate synthase [Wujia sp.]
MEPLIVHYDNKPIYNIEYTDNFDLLATKLSELGYADRKICVVSETNVASLYMDAILLCIGKCCSKTYHFVFPEGEQSKNLEIVKDLYTYLIENKFDRKDVLIALGGGVVGDLTGYTAATYLRGIDFIQVPTSLLSQVDSSIGGKTGVDFDSYKNMVGAFHMPKLVYINLTVLKTLSERQFCSGMGEIIKHGLIKDNEYFNWLVDKQDLIRSKQMDILAEMIRQSNVIKKNVVENDPTEKGERALLNFGHTLGHAIEKYMNFDFLHGECVLIGCILSTIISYNKQLISLEEKNRIIEAIQVYNIPKLPSDINITEIIKYTKNDKKVEGNKIKFILLRKIGEAYIDLDVSDEDMTIAIEEFISK